MVRQIQHMVFIGNIKKTNPVTTIPQKGSTFAIDTQVEMGVLVLTSKR